MPKCLACVRGFIEECDNGGCPDDVPTPTEANGEGDVSETDETTDEEREGDAESKRRPRRNKPDGALKDQQSTGRKRAAKLYPLNRSEPCEWRGKSNCGGGAKPIDGCTNGLQECRHHGPDYNTLNNDPENVSNICHKCHNRWHGANDSTKDDSYLILYGHKPKQLGKREITDEHDHEH